MNRKPPPIRMAFLTTFLTCAVVLLGGCDGVKVAPEVPHEPTGAGREEPFPPVNVEEPVISITAPAGDCPLDIAIHVPPAQDPAIPLIPEADKATKGAMTLRNNDIDVPQAEIARRLSDQNDLLKVDGIPDSAIAPLAGEDDLVRIDLVKARALGPVFLNAYAMALERGHTVPRKSGLQSPLLDDQSVHFWRQRNKAGPVSLPYQLTEEKVSLYVEGHKAGRYRLVLFHYPDGSLQKAKSVKAHEEGDPHQTPAAAEVTLDPALACKRNVRLTVAVDDIYQEARREHVFDVLWGGRARVDARVWPPNGMYNWGHENTSATWIDGQLRDAAVKLRGTGGESDVTKFATVYGGFVPDIVPVNQPVRGSGLYGVRLRLDYGVEGVQLRRDEPVTVMVPHRLAITPEGFVVNAINRGTDIDFAFRAAYRVFEQNNRTLTGHPPANIYARQYGARLRMYEALGAVAGFSDLRGEELFWTYPSPQWTALRLGTSPRIRAEPEGAEKTNYEGVFHDNFRFNLTRDLRNFFDVEIQGNRLQLNARIFAARQDIVALLNNDAAQYDVRVARGNVLEAVAPDSLPTGGRGPLGFRMILGASIGVALDTGNPDRVSDRHHP